MKTSVVVIALLFLAGTLSCQAEGKPWSRSDLKNYFPDSKVINLVLAANKGDVNKIDQLIKQGTNVNYKGKNNVTPLFAQMSSMNMDGFKKLLENGADPNLPTYDGPSVIWYAAYGGELSDAMLERLKLCLQHRGNPNWIYHHKYPNPIERDSQDGRSLLAAAILFNSRAIEALTLLLDAGADINIRDNKGETPLFYAVALSNYDIAYFLLQKGADYSIKSQLPVLTDKGTEPLNKTFIYIMENNQVFSTRGEKDLATQLGYRRKVIAFLKEKGIEVNLKYPD